VCHRLTEAALAAGVVPYLQAEGYAEQRIYARLGYHLVGELVTASHRVLRPEPVHTDRLLLVPLDPRTAHGIVAGSPGPVPSGEGWPHDDTLDALRMVAAGDGAGWLVTLDGTVICDCGTVGAPDLSGQVEIGYGLAAPYRGRGYGVELVRGLSRWLLDRPAITRVVAGVAPDNAPSRRALLRAGFTEDGTHDGDVRYALARAPR